MRLNVLAPLFLAGFAAQAHAAVIDFDDAALQGQVISSVSSDDGSVNADITVVGGADQAVVFDTSLSGTRDRDLEGPFRLAAGGPLDTNPGGVLIIQETAGGAPDDNARGGTITLDFDTLVDFTGFQIFDGARITLTSTDFAGSFDFEVPEPPNENAENRVYGSFDTTGLFGPISNLTFTFAGSGAIDGLQVAAVPVPASAVLLLGGIGGLGWMSRRRRKAAAA